MVKLSSTQMIAFFLTALLALSSKAYAGSSFIDEVKNGTECKMNSYQRLECSYRLSDLAFSIAGVGRNTATTYVLYKAKDSNTRFAINSSNNCIFLMRGLEAVEISPLNGEVHENDKNQVCNEQYLNGK